MSSPGVRSFALIAVVLSLPACATRRYSSSAIGAVPPAAGRSAGGGDRLRLSGLEVTLTALDSVPVEAGKTVTPPPLRLRVSFESKGLGYAFEPGRVVLRRGAELARARHSDASASGVAGDAGEGRFWLERRAAFELEFDRAVGGQPGDELVLDGLWLGRRPMAPVPLAITRRETVERSLKPGVKKVGEIVLKVPLTILMLPLAAAGGGM